MLSRITAVAAIALCPVTASADVEIDMNCTADLRADGNCVPMAGCLGEAGAYFTGRAIGWNDGTLAVQTSTGVFCSGTWVTRNFLGVGQADFVCDDGETGTALFTYQDPETGTAIGQGEMSNGAKIKVWSGRNIRRFLADPSGTLNGNLSCGTTLVPIS